MKTRDQLIEAAVSSFRELLTASLSAEAAGKPDDEMTLKEAAAELKVSESTLKSLLGMRGGDVRLSHYKRSGRIYLQRREIDRYKTDARLATEVMRTPQRRR